MPFPPNKKYKLLVSNDLGYEHADPDTLYDYYHVIILNDPYVGWTQIREINLTPINNELKVVNGFESKEFGKNTSSPLHFAFCMIVVPELENLKTRITVGSR